MRNEETIGGRELMAFLRLAQDYLETMEGEGERASWFEWSLLKDWSIHLAYRFPRDKQGTFREYVVERKGWKAWVKRLYEAME